MDEELLEVGKKYKIHLIDTYLSIWTEGVVEKVELRKTAKDSLIYGDDEWDLIEVRLDNGTRIEGYRREFIVEELTNDG